MCTTLTVSIIVSVLVFFMTVELLLSLCRLSFMAQKHHRIFLLVCVIFFPLKVNKRLDEWVTADRLDMKKLQFPKKEAKTPTKNGLSSSRPSSPEREVVSRYYPAKCLFHTLRNCRNCQVCSVIVQLLNHKFLQC